MSVALAPGLASDSEDETVRLLVQAADVLSYEARAELLRRLTTRHRVLSQDHAADLAPAGGRHANKRNALRLVATTIGHPPNTTEYGRYRDGSDEPLPSVSAICKAFGGWPKALIAAGLVPDAPASAYLQRVDYLRKQPHRYRKKRLAECLRACARDLDRTPMVRDYIAWRENARSDTTCDRDSIPHYRTFYNHFGSWEAALKHAGLPHERRKRTATTKFAAVSAARGKHDA